MENITALDTSLLGLNSASKLSSSGLKEKNRAKAEEAAESFEAFFMTRMMESMFDGVSTEGMFGGGQAEKIYRSLLLDEYGKEMAKVGSIGVKDYVMQAVLQMQEAAAAREING